MGVHQILRVAIGCDHAGFVLKYELLAALEQIGAQVNDVGCFPIAGGPLASVDYPDYATKVADAVISKIADLGVLICGSGIGMSIAANKVSGIRAALCHEPYSAAMARAHNDANILCLGARVVGIDLAKATLSAFVTGAFEGGRHQARLDKIQRNSES